MGRRLRRLKALITRRGGRIPSEDVIRQEIASEQLKQGMLRRTRAPIGRKEKKLKKGP